MRKLINRLGKMMKRFRLRDLFRLYLPRLRYAKYYRKLKIDEQAILLEAQHGHEMNGNIFYLLKALCEEPRYSGFKVYFTVRRDRLALFTARLKAEGMERVQPVVFASDAYWRCLASAKYLVNDTTFTPAFVKRPEQVYLNTWHGTPLKTLGRRVNSEMYGIGNVQKNFLFADYLLYPNTYTMAHMLEDFMLHDIGTARCVLSGYPRNAALLDTARAAEIRAKYGLEGKRVYAYLPTWRGIVGRPDRRATTYVQYFLYELDKALEADEVLYVNLHPLAWQNVVFSEFAHIRPFPQDVETYTFLNAADCLVTDYSSVFYDFAVTRKKCVLFAYDEAEYFESRGLYRPFSDLPFPKVDTVAALVQELRAPKAYDDTAFLKEYCAYDTPDAAERLLDLLLLGKTEQVILRDIPQNGKPNVLIYVGNLAGNGITTSAMNLLQNVDRTARNYFITFEAGHVKKNQAILGKLPEGVRYMPTVGKMNLSLFQKIVYLLFHARACPIGLYLRVMKKAYPLELRRAFADVPFESVIHFNGYETKKILLFSMFDTNRVIYVHSDMCREIETRNNQRRPVLEYAYTSYDRVAVVTEDIMEPTRSFLKTERTLSLAPNIIADADVRARSLVPLQFDETTRCNMSFDALDNLLRTAKHRIVNVGRFSPEKGHKRLIEAFDRVWQSTPDSALIIIGGNEWQGLFARLCEYVETLPSKGNIALVLSMTNPFPLVSACDGFILSSFYEGFGLVLAEADILGLPVVTTDITGPRSFMQKYGGTIVENTTDGIEDGLKRLIAGAVPDIDVDYDAYNREAVAAFEALLRKD